MLNLNSILIGTDQPEVMANFYEKVFAKKPDMVDSGYYGWLMGNTFITIGHHDQVTGQSKEPARLIFNFETDQVSQEFERIRNLGAQVIKQPDEEEGMQIATLADPDGNYFQLMSPWKG